MLRWLFADDLTFRLKFGSCMNSNLLLIIDVLSRRLKVQIEDLQSLINNEQEPHMTLGNSCSETDIEENDSFFENGFADCVSSHSCEPLPVGKPVSSIEQIEDDEALSSLSRCKRLQKPEKESNKRVKRLSRTTETSPQILSDSLGSPSTAVVRKRNRLILSDDEEDAQFSNRRLETTSLEDIATSNERG